MNGIEPTLVFGGGPCLFTVVSDAIVRREPEEEEPGSKHPPRARIVVHRIGGGDLVLAEGRRVSGLAATSSTVVWVESSSVFAIPIEGGLPREILSNASFLAPARSARGIVVAGRDQF